MAIKQKFNTDRGRRITFKTVEGGMKMEWQEQQYESGDSQMRAEVGGALEYNIKKNRKRFERTLHKKI